METEFRIRRLHQLLLQRHKLRHPGSDILACIQLRQLEIILKVA
jgi:hypothetical protein